MLAFLAHLTEGNVSFCHHFASVVRPTLTFSKKIFSFETTERIELKFLRNVPQCVGSKVFVFLINILHNIAAVTKSFYTPPTIVAGYIVFRSVRSFVRPFVRHTLLTLIFSGTTSHIVMKFCTLTHYIKDNILQLKMGSLGNVCPSEKLRFTFLLTFFVDLFVYLFDHVPGGVSMSSQTYAILIYLKNYKR